MAGEKKMSKAKVFGIVAVAMIFVAVIVFTILVPVFKESIIPEVPLIENDYGSSEINYLRVNGLKFDLSTACNVEPLCENPVIDIMAGHNKIVSYVPSRCSLNSMPESKSFNIEVTGSVLEGQKLATGGGCGSSSLSNVRVVERVECVVDADCSFTKKSQLLRTGAGSCEENVCFYDLISSEAMNQQEIEDVPIGALRSLGIKSKVQFVVVLLLAVIVLVAIGFGIYWVVRWK